MPAAATKEAAEYYGKEHLLSPRDLKGSDKDAEDGRREQAKEVAKAKSKQITVTGDLKPGDVPLGMSTELVYLEGGPMDGAVFRSRGGALECSPVTVRDDRYERVRYRRSKARKHDLAVFEFIPA